MFNKKNCLTASLLLSACFWATPMFADGPGNAMVAGNLQSDVKAWLCCECKGEDKWLQYNGSLKDAAAMSPDEGDKYCKDWCNKESSATTCRSLN